MTRGGVLLGMALGALSAVAKPAFFHLDRLYAVPGVPCEVYYAKLFDSFTPQAYLLEARSKVGRALEGRWSFTPTERDAGKSYEVVFNAWSDAEGLVDALTTTVVVAKAPVGDARTRRITMALLAASDTNCGYQDRLRERMREYGYAGYVPVGSHGGGSSSKVGEPTDRALHDGYGGFSWGSFLTRYALTVEEIDNVQAAAEREQLRRLGENIPPGEEWRKNLLKSPLLRLKAGRPTLDIQNWFDRINGGAAPDYIVIVLGGNGVFAQRPDVNPDVVGKELSNARRLVAALRAAAPRSVIAVGSSMGGSLDQDGWGRNYGAMQSCFLANRAWLAYDRAMKEFCETSGDARLVFVPFVFGVDPIGGYHTGVKDGNALHAKPEGGRQMGDGLFAWLANDLTARQATGPDENILSKPPRDESR